MKLKGHSLYDDQEFFEKYIQKRNQKDTPNELLEKPIIEELLGDVNLKKILELGCGDGHFGKELLDKGARSYFGMDASQKMIRLAKKNLSNFKCQVEVADIEQFVFSDKNYDLIVSRLVFHYLEKLDGLLKKIFSALLPGGSLIFSVEHPVITSCYDAYHQSAKRKNWIVDNYFFTGERINHWIGKDVVKYHRTVEDYFNLVKRNGFILECLRESKPQTINFKSKDEFERRSRIPLFLILKLSKPEK